jgi:hypothetical protein
VERDEVLAADVGVADLVDVGDVGAVGRLARAPLAPRPVGEAARVLHLEDGLPHDALADAHGAVGAVVVVDGRALPGAPADDEHLGVLAADDAAARVASVLELDERLQLRALDAHLAHPRVDFRE